MEDADVLDRDASELMLLRRLTRAAEGTMIEYVQSILEPARFGSHMRF